MFKLSKKSLSKLETCHSDLQKIVNEALKEIDITVAYGYRNREEQMKVYEKGLSKLKFPKSKHNSYPSKAVDIVPFPEMWKSEKRLIELSKIIFRIAKENGIKIRWGGDFNMDGDKTKNDAWDKAHYELI